MCLCSLFCVDRDRRSVCVSMFCVMAVSVFLCSVSIETERQKAGERRKEQDRGRENFINGYLVVDERESERESEGERERERGRERASERARERETQRESERDTARERERERERE